MPYLHRPQHIALALAFCLSVIPMRSTSAAAQQDGARATSTKDSGKGEKDSAEPLPASAVKNPVLWHQPSDIASLDLLNGQGGAQRKPVPPFTFEDEDLNGTNPKMDVRDSGGTKWRVKEGEEARPEVVASRLLWAVGYYANDDYLLQTATVSGVEVKRGSSGFKAGNLSEVRFSRKPSGEKKLGIWEWRSNPFTGQREFNGLRVMMAVMNNWDLKDVNNSVYSDKQNGTQIFLVNDVGATFGANGVGFTRAGSKGNINSFRASKFIKRLTATEVDFSTPKPPTGVLLTSFGGSAKSYFMRAGLSWIGNNIPRADARWIGTLLAQLSHQQLLDAFRAGDFPAKDVDGYVEIIEARIAELKKL